MTNDTNENEMNAPKTITIDNIEYVRKDSIRPSVEYGGEYRGPHVVILDRGFIFHGNLRVSDDGLHTLTDCVNVRKWKTGGTGGLIRSARDSAATLDPSADIVFRDPILVAPVGNDWR